MEDLQRHRDQLQQQGQRIKEYENELDELQKMYLAVLRLQRQRWDEHRRLWFSQTKALRATTPRSSIYLAKLRRDSESYRKYLDAHDTLMVKHGIPAGVCVCETCCGRCDHYDPCRWGSCLNYIDPPLLYTRGQVHPRFAPGSFEGLGALVGITFLGAGSSLLHDVNDPPTPWISPFHLVGLCAAVLLGLVTVLDLVVHDAGNKFLKLCRDSGVQGLRARPSILYIDRFALVFVAPAVVFTWSWKTVLVGWLLAVALFWQRRKTVWFLFKDMYDLNDTIAQLGVIDNWPLYEQLLLPDLEAQDGGSGEKAGNDLLVGLESGLV